MKTKLIEAGIHLFCRVSVVLVLGAVFTIIFFLLSRAVPVLNLKLFFGNTPAMAALLLKKQVFNGIFPALVGTVTLVVLSVIMAVPMGICTGIYMAEYSPGLIRSTLGFFFDLLAGIPSIVVGLTGFSMALFLHHHFSRHIVPCLLISAISLAFLVLPYIVKTTQLALESVPRTTRLTGLALGASKFQNTIHVLLPGAFPDILSGIILALGRCAEDTAVIMLTGVVASAGVPDSLFKGYEALPFFIYYTASQYMDAGELNQAYGACVVLLVVCALLFLFAAAVQKLLSRHLFHGSRTASIGRSGMRHEK